MLIYNGQVIAGGGTIVLPMTRAEYEANKAVLDTADVWIDLTDEPDQVAEADQIAYSVGGVQKSMGYIGDIATNAVAKVEPTDTALYLHEVGEYFINKDGNACKVDTQIPVGGTITLGANCHVLSKGVANDISSKLADYQFIVEWDGDSTGGVEKNFDYSNYTDFIVVYGNASDGEQNSVQFRKGTINFSSNWYISLLSWINNATIRNLFQIYNNKVKFTAGNVNVKAKLFAR